MTKLTKPIHRVTLGVLTGDFGPDRNKRVVITLIPGNGESTADLLELRPERTRRPERIAVIDAYRLALRARVESEYREKQKVRRERKAMRLAAQRIARAERRLVRPL